jgi:hypothetical protein
MVLREIECQGVEWTHLAQDSDQWRTLVNTVMIFKVAQNFMNLFSICRTISFCSMEISVGLCAYRNNMATTPNLKVSCL